MLLHETNKVYLSFTNELLRGLFVLNFVISGKVTSLPKVIKYVKRSKYSFHDFNANHTPSATLNPSRKHRVAEKLLNMSRLINQQELSLLFRAL